MKDERPSLPDGTVAIGLCYDYQEAIYSGELQIREVKILFEGETLNDLVDDLLYEIDEVISCEAGKKDTIEEIRNNRAQIISGLKETFERSTEENDGK